MHTRTLTRRALVGAVALATAVSGLSAAPSAGAQGPTCLGQPATIVAIPGVPTVGTSGDDVIVGTTGNDVIRGRGGDDLICARAGDDNVKGNGGNDQIDLGPGNDEAAGGKGNDWIHGKSGRDRLRGNSGGDQLRGGKGRDVLRGDKGIDFLHGGSARDILFGGSGTDLLIGGKSIDDCRGGRGLDAYRSCNEPTDAIDTLSVFLDASDLGGDWTLAGAPTLSPTTPLNLCGTWVENDIGISIEGLIGSHTSADAFALFGQVVRVHTERTAADLIDRTNAQGATSCEWSFRNATDTATNHQRMIEPLDVTPMGDGFSQAHYEFDIDNDDPATADVESKVVVLQMRCGPIVARYWVWYSTPPISVEALDAMTEAVHTKLSAATAAAGIDCAQSPS